jgi:hypothetical protein
VAIWPAQLFALALGVVILVLLRSKAAWQGRIILAILAGFWLWVAWAYLWERYDTINWVARYFAIGFGLQATLLLSRGVFHAPSFQLGFDPASRVGLGIFLFAVFLHPLIAPALGRPWTQAEIFGIAPDPTVIGTLGLLLMTEQRVAWELFVIPIIWCAISSAILWTMTSPDALLALVLGGFSLVVAFWKSMHKAVPQRSPLIG